MDILKFYFNELKPFKSTNEENLVLYHRWKEGDAHAYNRLVRNFLPLVIKIAKKYSSSSSTLEDLIQEGNMNLLIGLNKFEESKGALAPYLALWIDGGIIRYLKKDNGVVHIPENVVNTKSYKLSYRYLDQQDRDTKRFELEDKWKEESDDVHRCNHFLNTLSKQDKQILELAFGIGYSKGHNANEIAKILDISNVTVRNRFKAVTGITINSILEKEPNFETYDNHAKTISQWLDDHLEYVDRVTYEVVSRGTNLHLSVIKKSVTEDHKLRIKNHNRLLSSP